MNDFYKGGFYLIWGAIFIIFRNIGNFDIFNHTLSFVMRVGLTTLVILTVFYGMQFIIKHILIKCGVPE